MAADSFTTDSMQYAACLEYIFGQESLVAIRIGDSGKASFDFCIPSLDAESYINDYENGELIISDAKALFKSNSRLFGAVRALRVREETSWVSKSWIKGRTADGRKIK